MSNNNEIHRTIGMTPLQADWPAVVLNQREISDKRIAFKISDKVRISCVLGGFHKGVLTQLVSGNILHCQNK